MKPFSLNEYLANPSKEVITRDGRKVQIRCTDVRSDIYPIVAIVEKHNLQEDCVFTYTKDGRHFAYLESDDDLFFACKKHEGWINVYKSLNNVTYCGGVFETEEEARKEISANYRATIKIEWEE